MAYKVHADKVHDNKVHNDSKPTQWLLNNWPNVRIAAKTTLMERQRFPSFVQEYIEEKWIKVSDTSGGIWEEPVYHLQQKEKLYRRDFPRKATLALPMIDKNKMDQNNKKAMEIISTQGIEAGIKHMFTHPRTGQAMSYSEMRSMYG